MLVLLRYAGSVLFLCCVVVECIPWCFYCAALSCRVVVVLLYYVLFCYVMLLCRDVSCTSDVLCDSGVSFSKTPKLFGPISGDIIFYLS